LNQLNHGNLGKQTITDQNEIHVPVLPQQLGNQPSGSIEFTVLFILTIFPPDFLQQKRDGPLGRGMSQGCRKNLMGIVHPAIAMMKLQTVGAALSLAAIKLEAIEKDGIPSGQDSETKPQSSLLQALKPWQKGLLEFARLQRIEGPAKLSRLWDCVDAKDGAQIIAPLPVMQTSLELKH
jgi:hypothetical protein